MSSVSARKLKKQSSVTRFEYLDEKVFFMSNGIQKRRIFYNVNYTEQEEKWIKTVRRALKKEDKFQIKEDQVILRYFYSSDLNLEKCLQRLTKYHQWFTNPEIQQISEEMKQIIRQGFVYAHGKAKDGRPIVIMNIGILNLDKYSLTNYYKAINYTLNKVIRQGFVPGHLETYYFIIDVDQKLLTLPITSTNEIINVLSNAYSMFLQKMMVVNLTTITKWIANRLISFASQETARKISLHTNQDLKAGQLRAFIDVEVLQKKYGGIKHNINHHKQFRVKERNSMLQEQLSETQYFSIQQIEDPSHYRQKSCCGIEQCRIY